MELLLQDYILGKFIQVTIARRKTKVLTGIWFPSER